MAFSPSPTDPNVDNWTFFFLGGMPSPGSIPRGGIKDFKRKYGLMELAKGNVMFAATGVTDGSLLRGVRRWKGGGKTHSIVMRSRSGTIREVRSEQRPDRSFL